MKFLWVAFLLPLPGLTAAAQSPTQMPAVDGTVALYQFNEGSGTTTADEVGTSPATLKGTDLPFWTAGMDGGALDFTPAGGHLRPIPSIPVGSNWTIQAVVKFPVATNATGINYLAGYGLSAGSHVVLSGGELGMITDGGTTALFLGCGYSVAALQGWYLVSAVGSGGRTTFYVDSTPVGVAAGQTTSTVTYIGGIFGDRPWGGPIDSMRIMDVALSESEIASDVTILAPKAPQAAGQFNLAGDEIDPGASSSTRFVVRATVNGASLPHHLEVEVKPVHDEFNGTTDLFAGADVPDGKLATVSVTGLAPGPYHWQVRARDAYGDSPWISFGQNPDAPGETDVVVLANSAPSAGPASQALDADGSLLGAGQFLFDADRVRFEAGVSDPDADTVRLQVELRPFGSAFTGQATAESAPVASGQTAVCGVALAPGSHSWQYRAVDSLGAASAWTPYGDGSSPDLVVKSAGSSGVPGCGGSTAGTGVAGTWTCLLLLAAIRRR